MYKFVFIHTRLMLCSSKKTPRGRADIATLLLKRGLEHYLGVVAIVLQWTPVTGGAYQE